MIVDDVRNHLQNGHQTVKRSKSCQSAHGTDSTFSSVKNIEEVIINNITHDPVELESDFSTGLTEDISIDESDEIDPQPIYLEYKRTSSSS